MRNSLNFSGWSDGLIWLQSTLWINQMRCKNGIDQCRFSKTSLTWTILAIIPWIAVLLIIPTQMTLNWNPLLSNLRSIWFVIVSKPTWVLGVTGVGPCCWGGSVAVAIARIPSQRHKMRMSMKMLGCWSIKLLRSFLLCWYIIQKSQKLKGKQTAVVYITTRPKND